MREWFEQQQKSQAFSETFNVYGSMEMFSMLTEISVVPFDRQMGPNTPSATWITSMDIH